jgi:hypothetical protein
MCASAARPVAEADSLAGDQLPLDDGPTSEAASGHGADGQRAWRTQPSDHAEPEDRAARPRRYECHDRMKSPSKRGAPAGDCPLADQAIVPLVSHSYSRVSAQAVTLSCTSGLPPSGGRLDSSLQRRAVRHGWSSMVGCSFTRDLEHNRRQALVDVLLIALGVVGLVGIQAADEQQDRPAVVRR